MKLKYYMLGLGIGILLTTLILAVAKPKGELTDQEIIDRAKALGMELKSDRDKALREMLENGGTSGELSPNPSQPPEKSSPDSQEKNKDTDPSEGMDVTPEPTAASEETTSSESLAETTSAPDAEAESGTSEKPPVSDTPADSPSSTDTEDTEVGKSQGRDGVNAGELITFTIEKGMPSGTVAALLKEAGLIQDVSEFNQYIIEKGKASVIEIGTYTLPVGVTYDEIISNITE